MADDYELTPRARQILEEIEPILPRDDVTVHYDEAIPEDLKEAVKAILSEHPDLWFIEARTKDCKTVLIHRGPPPLRRTMTDDERTIRIRNLNDELRTKGHALNGRIVAMGGLANDDREKQIRVLQAAAQFNDWTEGDDPYGEHDFGKFDLDGEAFMFKIDYYAIGDEAHGSEHPEDPNVTVRVMTLMHAEDYLMYRFDDKVRAKPSSEAGS